jgi:hypothetical protein
VVDKDGVEGVEALCEEVATLIGCVESDEVRLSSKSSIHFC